MDDVLPCQTVNANVDLTTLPSAAAHCLMVLNNRPVTLRLAGYFAVMIIACCSDFPPCLAPFPQLPALAPLPLPYICPHIYIHYPFFTFALQPP